MAEHNIDDGWEKDLELGLSRRRRRDKVFGLLSLAQNGTVAIIFSAAIVLFLAWRAQQRIPLYDENVERQTVAVYEKFNTLLRHIDSAFPKDPKISTANRGSYSDNVDLYDEILGKLEVINIRSRYAPSPTEVVGEIANNITSLVSHLMEQHRSGKLSSELLDIYKHSMELSTDQILYFERSLKEGEDAQKAADAVLSHVAK